MKVQIQSYRKIGLTNTGVAIQVRVNGNLSRGFDTRSKKYQMGGGNIT